MRCGDGEGHCSGSPLVVFASTFQPRELAVLSLSERLEGQIWVLCSRHPVEVAELFLSGTAAEPCSQAQVFAMAGCFPPTSPMLGALVSKTLDSPLEPQLPC